jgi:hypothetical protein
MSIARHNLSELGGKLRFKITRLNRLVLIEVSCNKRKYIMKIVSAPYTSEHGLRALKRLHKAIICNQVLPSNLHQFYKAMLHLERYVERLNPKPPTKGVTSRFKS